MKSWRVLCQPQGGCKGVVEWVESTRAVADGSDSDQRCQQAQHDAQPQQRKAMAARDTEYASVPLSPTRLAARRHRMDKPRLVSTGYWRWDPLEGSVVEPHVCKAGERRD